VRLYPEGQGAVLEVSDVGPGMSERDAARAFDRFHRGTRDGALNGHRAGHDGAEAAGSGLGLSIVHAIAAAHGGHARLRSAPGAGTTVWLWIPLRAVSSFSERTVAPPETPPDSLLAGSADLVIPKSFCAYTMISLRAEKSFRDTGAGVACGRSGLLPG
jgi:hypothetical protein